DAPPLTRAPAGAGVQADPLPTQRALHRHPCHAGEPGSAPHTRQPPAHHGSPDRIPGVSRHRRVAGDPRARPAVRALASTDLLRPESSAALRLRYDATDLPSRLPGLRPRRGGAVLRANFGAIVGVGPPPGSTCCSSATSSRFTSGPRRSSEPTSAAGATSG